MDRGGILHLFCKNGEDDFPSGLQEYSVTLRHRFLKQRFADYSQTLIFRFLNFPE